MEIILHEALTQRGYKIGTRPFELNIIGIRANTAESNAFDDSIHVLFTDSTGKRVAYSWMATTDPGTHWLKAPLNDEGTAILKPGQYLHSHALGMHRGVYLALVQVNPVTVLRDNNRNNLLHFDAPKEETGLFGINIHRAQAVGTTKVIDSYSAGCQVFANAEDFGIFLQLAERHKALYGNSFTYTLLAGLPDGSLPKFDNKGKVVTKKG